MTKLEIFQRAMFALRAAESEEERAAILEQCRRDMDMGHEGADPNERVNAITVMFAMFQNMITKTGYDLEKAENDPTADPLKVAQLRAQFREVLEPFVEKLKEFIERTSPPEGGAK